MNRSVVLCTKNASKNESEREWVGYFILARETELFNFASLNANSVYNNKLETRKSKGTEKHGDWLFEFSKNQEFQLQIMGQ